MIDLAWDPARDARDPDVVAGMVNETCGALAAGRVRPLVAVRRAGKTWALRAIEHARRATHQAHFLDVGTRPILPSLATLPAGESTSLLLIDEPGPWLADAGRAAQLFDWLDALAPTCHVVLALTPAELGSLHGFDRGKAACDLRSAVYLPTPREGELTRAARGHDLSTAPWRWRSSFYLLRTWMQAHADLPTATTSEVAEAAARMLRVGGKDVHLSAVFTDSLPPETREALQKLGRGEAVGDAPRDELVRLGLVRADHTDGPWHITDPALAALLTPLRIHHISDVHIGDNAASTVDTKHDPTTDRRIIKALRNTFVRDKYVTELDQLARRGLGPHLVVISGDLVERAGDAAQIAQARAWVEQVRAWAGANEHPCLHDGDPRVLLVGGNHDVDWSTAADPDQHARHRPFAAAFADLPHPHLEQPLATRDCAPVLYRDARVAFWLLGSAELGGEQLADPRLRALFELAERLATDDSSRMALDPHRPRLERIDPGLVAQHALDAAAPPASVPVRIAVLHHPVTALAGTAPEVASFTGLINAATVKAALRQKGYQLVLHGHLHHGALVTETSHDNDGAPALHIAAAPTLGSKETQEQRGYNAISIARALPVPGQIDQIRVRVERLTHGGKGAGWKPDGACWRSTFRPDGSDRPTARGLPRPLRRSVSCASNPRDALHAQSPAERRSQAGWRYSLTGARESRGRSHHRGSRSPRTWPDRRSAPVEDLVTTAPGPHLEPVPAGASLRSPLRRGDISVRDPASLLPARSQRPRPRLIHHERIAGHGAAPQERRFAILRPAREHRRAREPVDRPRRHRLRPILPSPCPASNLGRARPRPSPALADLR